MRERIKNLSRRELLKLAGITLGATIIDSAAWPRRIQAQSRKITPRKNARNVLVIQNCGAMSPPETLDFHESKWTAKDHPLEDGFYLWGPDLPADFVVNYEGQSEQLAAAPPV